MNPANQQGIDISKTTGIVCENCGHNVFREAAFLRIASRFLTGSPRDIIAPVATFECAKCNHVNDQFNPMKNLTTDEDA
jgi:DNA-directed RNA polymerase subunit RPC12/RpoP